MVGVIKLFDATSTDFTTNGLGSLNDCLSCVIEEERNGQYELTMTYPVTGRRYNDLENRQIIFCKAHPSGERDYQAFRIYSISRPINGQIEINARHISYDLSGFPMAPLTYVPKVNPSDPDVKVVTALSDIFNNYEEGQHGSRDSVFLYNDDVHGHYSPCADDILFTFWTDKTSSVGMYLEKPYPIRTILGGVKGSVLDTYGGEYEFDNFEVRLWHNRGTDSNVTIRYGKNITDFKQEENCAETYTAVYPYWFTDEVDEEGTGGQEKEDQPPKIVELPEKLVQVYEAEGLSDYHPDPGYTKVLVYDTSEHFKERPSIEQLREHTIQYIKDNDIGIPKVSIDLSFITLERAKEYELIEMAETINLCDTVTVFFPKLNVEAKSKCIKTKYDVLKDRYESISLGTPKMEVADTIAETITAVKESNTDTRSSYQEAMIRAANLITGHSGPSYVILNPASDPREIIISDNPVYTDSNAHVWVWNANGLGYFDQGYGSPQTHTAITNDGRIIADTITAGTFDGALIKAGSIQASAISLDYTAQVGTMIENASRLINQSFGAADGTLWDYINQFEKRTNDGYDSLEEKHSALVQTVEGLSFSVSEQVTGGSNKIRNSVGLNGNDGWTTDGEVYSISDNDASLESTVSGSEWFLNAGSLSRFISLNKNKNYILSFKYKLNTSMKCEVILHNGDQTERVLLTAVQDYASNNTYNTDDIVKHSETVDDISIEHVYKCLDDGVTGDWDETKWELYPVTAWYSGTTDQWVEVVHKFKANNKTVELIMSTIGNGFYISDLYILEGTIPGSWQPAESEMYGKSVRIDKEGITVFGATDPEDPNSNPTKTVMDDTGFSVWDLEGHKLLSVNPNYTWLLRTEIKHELDVGKLRIMPTDIGAELMIMGQEVE